MSKIRLKPFSVYDRVPTKWNAVFDHGHQSPRRPPVMGMYIQFATIIRKCSPIPFLQIKLTDKTLKIILRSHAILIFYITICLVLYNHM